MAEWRDLSPASAITYHPSSQNLSGIYRRTRQIRTPRAQPVDRIGNVKPAGIQAVVADRSDPARGARIGRDTPRKMPTRVLAMGG